MGKKSKRNRSSKLSSSSAAATATETELAPRLPPARRTVEEETLDNLRFEDPFVEDYLVDDDDDDDWEDDAADDDKIVAAKYSGAVHDDDDADDDGQGGSDTVVQSWNPLTGQPLQAGEALEMDASAYKMHHAMTPEWPALSFDFVRDDLGSARTRFPHTLTVAVGTQADAPQHNALMVLQISDLSKMAVETEDDILGEEYNPDNADDDEDDEDDDDDDDDEMEPVMEHYSIPHYGGVNRVRVMPQNPDIVATWSDAGAIHLFNVASIRQRFDSSRGKGAAVGKPWQDIPTKPFFSYSTKHHTEGYALDWSTINQGHLVSADCEGSIQLWSPKPDGKFVVTPFYSTANDSTQLLSNKGRSIEDLQWSPTEATVFATAECQGYVRIFDTRAPSKAMLTHQIHTDNVDVNVLSWNKLVHNLLATGGDDGTLAVWDLRHFANPSSSKPPSPLARFTPHKTPITSVEWHPTDESMLATSDDVGTYVYDLSVEEDVETMRGTDGYSDVPPQLLFVHCGSEQFKEVHWHPQISSCLMTTALTGFSIFIPSNL
jgi:ribosome assembly protein RRB1